MRTEFPKVITAKQRQAIQELPVVAKRGSKKKFLRAMKKVANIEPEAHDRL